MDGIFMICRLFCAEKSQTASNRKEFLIYCSKPLRTFLQTKSFSVILRMVG